MSSPAAPRILHLNTEPTWRGGEQQVLYLLDGLRARGIAATLVAQPGKPMAERARANGHDVVELRMRGEVDLLAVVRLYRLLRDGGYTVVHAHTSHAHTLGALAAALFGRSPRRPQVVVARRVDFSIFRRSFLGLNGLKYRHGVDQYVTVSEAIRQVLITDGLPPERIACVHSGIDLGRIEGAPDRKEAIRAELGVPEGHALIANVAHMADHKGQRYLVEAMPAILAACPRTVCAIVGDGELRGELEDLAARLGVTHAMRFPGFRNDVPSLLKALDLFVMPSHMEGLGTSVLDAMAAGAPVVGTEAGGMPEAIEHGVTGLVCPVRDAAALARAITSLLQEPARARALADAARVRVRERFSTDAMVDGTARVYARLAEQRAAPRPGALEAYKPLKRLVPFFRPYLLHVALLVAVAVAYSQSDAGRARLVQPLVNKVLLRGGEVKQQVRDELLAAPPAQVAATRAALTPMDPDALRRLEDLALGAPPAHTPGDDDPGLSRLLRRTHRALLTVADDPDLPPDQATWRAMALAVAEQQRAVQLAAVPGQESLAAGLSLDARQTAFDLGFKTAQATLKWVFWVALGLAFALAATHYGMFYLSRALTAKIFVDLQNRMADRLLGLSVRYFEGERRGDLLSRLTADLQLMSNVLTSLMGDLLIQSINLTVLVVNALFLSPQLCVALVFLGGTILLPLRRWGKRLRRHSRRRQGATGDVLEVLQQMLAGLRVVKAFQRERHEDARFAKQVALATDAQVQAIRAREAAKTWLQFMNDVTVPVCFAAGSFLVLRHQWDLDAGRFGAFLGLVLLMYLPTKALGEAYGTLNDSLPAIERVFEVLDARPEVVDAPDARPAPALREAIRYEDVVFSYDPEKPVLRGISFEARAGTMNAIVGETGSGKSTLMDLLCRYRDPLGGRITIDGQDLRGLTLASWLDRVAIVPQQSFLFNDTVRENIRYGRLDATDAEVEEAARTAGVHDDIVEKPEGYAFSVGERGSRLSGGQQQRVALARAILKRPDVLILDEATSALDSRTERLVQQALERLATRCTTFVIAHRLSTVLKADQILVLDGGRLVERGRHEELMAMKGLYARLVRMQELTTAEA